MLVMENAIDLAKWFINNGYEASNTKEGNIKLNKLLYFAQLISLIKLNKPIFKDDLYAFENGVVVETVRQEFRYNYSKFIRDAEKQEIKIEKDYEDILNFTKDVFINVSAKELSELTHEHKCWQDYYKKSKSGTSNWFNKEAGKIPIEKIYSDYQEDLDLVRNILSAYNESESEEQSINLNGVTFYYDPKEVKLDESIEKQLLKFPAVDSAYTFYIDEKQGLVIY